MRRWRRRRCARSARESARAGPGCGGWRCSTASAGSRSVSRACSSPCRRRTARRRSRRAGTRSTRSSGRCPSGRRSTSRTARSGSVSRADSLVTVLERVERTIRRHAMLAGGECVLVAVSGGADSVALLHALTTLAPAWGLRLHALHVDHGLRVDSARDAKVVRRLGERFGVPVEVVAVTVERRGSLEAAARAARRSEEHTSELQSPCNLVCRLLLEKKKKKHSEHYLVTIKLSVIMCSTVLKQH